MYICLYRNKPQGAAITGRLVIDGRWFCNTLERVGYQIPALCYHVAVTMSPKFKRLLPLVTGVPRLPIGGTPSNSQSPIANRSGIRFHRGTKPEHSTGCVLVLADNELKTTQTTISQTNTICDKENDSLARCDVGTAQMLSKLSSKSTKPVVVGRSAAEVEKQLTDLLLETQNNHEEIILEVIDYRPGTEYGYDTPCPSSEWAYEKEIRAANFARRHSSSILETTSFSDGF
jgi:hypothetical protein